MLKQLNIRNFLSFDQMPDGTALEISMLPGRARKHHDHFRTIGDWNLLPLALIYGANGSGKSNLMKAFLFIKECVILGTCKNGTGKYNRNSIRNRKKSSYFEIEFFSEGKLFDYGFEAVLSEAKFCSEWLYYTDRQTGREHKLFDRDIETGAFSLGSVLKQKGLKERFAIYLEDIRTNTDVLFLNEINTNKNRLFHDHPQAVSLQEAYRWFSRNLTYIGPERERKTYVHYMNKKTIKLFEKILIGFGTGIKRIELKRIPKEEVITRFNSRLREKLERDLVNMVPRFDTNDNNIEAPILILNKNDNIYQVEYQNDDIQFRELQMIHDGHDGEMTFSLNEESDGTVRLLDLADILTNPDNKVFIVDELDRCLHPNLIYHFIEEYLLRSQGKNSQLICTTHDAGLMDLNLVRRDELWMINKNRFGDSQIYSLEQYNERFDRVVEKAYLQGRYGGVPVFRSLFVDAENTDRV